MSYPSKLPVLQSLLRPLPKSQSKTVLLAFQAIAAFFAQASGSQIDSALTRFYRLLHNPRLDDLQITKQFLSVLAQGRSSLWIALDWTEWHPPLRMLLASVIVGTRALPVQSAVFSQTHIHRSQNAWENQFLR